MFGVTEARPHGVLLSLVTTDSGANQNLLSLFADAHLPSGLPLSHDKTDDGRSLTDVVSMSLWQRMFSENDFISLGVGVPGALACGHSQISLWDRLDQASLSSVVGGIAAGIQTPGRRSSPLACQERREQSKDRSCHLRAIKRIKGFKHI